MDYRDYKPEDFLLDASFCNYCLERNEEDTFFWKHWILLHPEKAPAVEQAKKLYLLLNGNHTAEQYKRDLEQFTIRLGDHLMAEPPANDPAATARPKPRIGYHHRGRRQSRTYAAVGAAGVLAVIILFLLHPGNPTSPAGFRTSSKAGERRTILLQDGSKVLLNAASELAVTTGFGDSIREVSLKGEAYFDIAKVAGKPFIVHTDAMDIRVLGTEFNVRAYPAEKITEAALVKGSIEVMLKSAPDRRIVLHPSEKISCAAAPTSPDIAAAVPARITRPAVKVEKLAASPVDSLPAEISWTVNCLVFQDNTLEEIAPRLERWYNVTIRFDDAQVKDYRYTATFQKKTIDQVLEALALSRPFAFHRENDSLIVIGSANIK